MDNAPGGLSAQLDYWHLVVGGGPLFFFGVFLFRSGPRFICLFLVLLRFFFFFIFSTDSMYSPSMSCVWSVRCMEWKETGFGPCVDLHKPKQHHGALEQ